MKNIKLLLLAIAFISFISCSDDDGFTQQDVVGDWILTDATFESKSTVTANRTVTTLDQTGEYKSGDYAIDFVEDGTYTFDGSMVMEVDNFINGDFTETTEIDYEEFGMDLMGDGTWSFINNQLILDNESQQDLKVEGKLMTFNIDDVFQISPDFQMELTMELVFTKQ